MEIKDIFRRLSLLLNFCLLAFFLHSCGGGTSGTDGGVKMRIAGVLETTEGTKIVYSTITLEETGDSTLTDEAGRFELITDVVISGKLLIEGKIGGDIFTARSQSINFNQITQLDNIKLVVSVSNGAVSVEELSVNLVPTPSNSPKPEETSVVTESILSGRILFADNLPAKGVIFNIKGQGRSQVSDKNGRFKFQFPVGKESLSLVVKYKSAETTVTLRQLPQYPIEIKINLKLGFKPDDGTMITSGMGLGLDSKYSIKER